MTARPRYTEADLDQMPDDGNRYEIIGGNLLVTPPPSTEHQGISAILSGVLFRAQEAGYGRYFAAPTGVVLPTGDSAEPDLLFIHRDRLHIIAPDKVRGVPDLVIEILSPSNPENDLVRKYQAYERAGVPFYWVVDPAARAVQPYTLREGAYAAEATLHAGDRLGSPLFPGITLDIGELFLD
jgi:Uma2 family endonuclease